MELPPGVCAEDKVWPRFLRVPMGWSHSVLVAQALHENLLREADALPGAGLQMMMFTETEYHTYYRLHKANICKYHIRTKYKAFCKDTDVLSSSSLPYIHLYTPLGSRVQGL